MVLIVNFGANVFLICYIQPRILVTFRCQSLFNGFVVIIVVGELDKVSKGKNVTCMPGCILHRPLTEDMQRSLKMYAK